MAFMVQVLAVAALAGVLATPVAMAQVAEQVASCQHECTPWDVNPNAPNTGDEPTRVILYAHFHDILNQAPLTTQAADMDCAADLDQGFVTPTLRGPRAVPGGPGFHPNQFTMFASLGAVEYAPGDCQRRVHEQSGMAENMSIVSDHVMLYFYLSSHAAGEGWVGVMPQVAVKARMETGRAYEHGRVIAQADTGRGGMAGLVGGDRVNLISTPDGAVYEFAVPMRVESRDLLSLQALRGNPLDSGFIVTFEIYQVGGHEGAADGVQVAQNDWHFRSGADFPPRIVFDVDKALQTKGDPETPALSLHKGDLFIRWNFASPFGSYDIDEGSAAASVTGPGPIDPNAPELVMIRRSINHDGYGLPVRATWKFDPGATLLADGWYEIHLSIENRQKTYLLEHVLGFEVAAGQIVDVPEVSMKKAATGEGLYGHESPGVGSLVALFLIGVCFWVRRSSP